jgi:hypothetical protein
LPPAEAPRRAGGGRMRRQHNGVGPVIPPSSGRSCCSSPWSSTSSSSWSGRLPPPRMRLARAEGAGEVGPDQRWGATSVRSAEGRRRRPELVGRPLAATGMDRPRQHRAHAEATGAPEIDRRNSRLQYERADVHGRPDERPSKRVRPSPSMRSAAAGRRVRSSRAWRSRPTRRPRNIAATGR